MTQVRLALSAPTADGPRRRPSGSLEWRATKRRAVSGDVVLPAPFTVGVGTDTPPVIQVDPTGPDWAWEVVERVQGGAPRKRTLAVPDSVAVVDYADLVELDPATLDPAAQPEAAWWAALHTVATVVPDPGDPNALIVGGTAVATDPADSNALILTGA